MILRWRRVRQSVLTLRLLASATVVLIFLYTRLAYDNPVRLSLRFNTNKATRFIAGPRTSDRWLYEGAEFPVDWASDVAVIVKTGYGTQERAVAWLEALPAEISPEDVLVVGDFETELAVGEELPLELKVHDVVSNVLKDYDGAMATQDMFPQRAEKYRTLGAVIAAGDDQAARDLSASFGWELDAMKFIPALELAYHTMPHKKWFLLADDDTYLIQPSLDLVLRHFDPSLRFYLGNAVGDYRQRFAHGGSSIALSRATLQELFSPANAHLLAEARRESLAEVWGDRLLARTLLRMGIYIDEDSSRFFNGEQPWATRLSRDRFCAPVATFHRLSTREMAAVGRTFRTTADPVMWVDLWARYGAPPLKTYEERPLRRGWDHVGQLDEHTITVEDVTLAEGCSRLCVARQECLAWTWEEEEELCHLGPWITVGKEAGGKVSGLHVDRVRKLTDACR